MRQTFQIAHPRSGPDQKTLSTTILADSITLITLVISPFVPCQFLMDCLSPAR